MEIKSNFKDRFVYSFNLQIQNIFPVILLTQISDLEIFLITTYDSKLLVAPKLWNLNTYSNIV